MLNKPSFLSALAVTACLATTQVGAADVQATRTAEDHVIQGNFQADGGIGTPVLLLNNSNARRVGTGGASGAQRVNQPILGFVLPTIPAGEPISAATFSITLDAIAIQGAPIPHDMVVSLMGATDISGISGTDFVEVPGPTGLGAGNAFVGTRNANDADIVNDGEVVFPLTGDALTQLAGLYDGAGNPTQTEVFFRLSPSVFIDTTDPTNGNDRFNFARDPDQVVRSLTLTVGSVLDPADLDGDGDVDDADFGIAFAAFTGPNNGPSSNPAADLDGDGDVDDADFGIAFAAFTGPGGAAVPEPTSLALLGLGGLLIARRRRAS